MEASFEQRRLSRPRQSILVMLFQLVAVYLFIGIISTAEAQTEAQIAEAAEHHERGIDLFREGRFEESIAAFERAESIAHSPANLMNLARCNQELGRNDQAIAHLEQYLAATDITAEQRSRATSILERLRASSASSDNRDSTPSVESDSGDDARLQNEGPVAEESVEAPPSPIEVEDTGARPLAEPPVEESENAGLAGPWAVLGSGLGLLLVGGILDIAAYTRAGEREFASQGDYDSWLDSTTNLAIAGDVLVGVGAAATIGGLIWLLIARNRSSGASSRAGRFNIALGGAGGESLFAQGTLVF